MPHSFVSELRSAATGPRSASGAHDFLVHAPGDAVGVAVRDIEPGPGVTGRVQTGGGHIEIAARDPIPLGHKIALRNIARGEHVIKYGTTIGRATADISAGQHVHVHNLKGERWA